MKPEAMKPTVFALLLVVPALLVGCGNHDTRSEAPQEEMTPGAATPDTASTPAPSGPAQDTTSAPSAPQSMPDSDHP